MENQPTTIQPSTPVSQPASPPPMPPTQPMPKRNPTPWIILILLLGATIITAMAYFVIPQSLTKKVTIPQVNNQTETQTSNPQELVQWETYKNTKYQYSFFYPITWKIENVKPDQKSLSLQFLEDVSPATITIQYLTSEERSKLQPTFCQTNTDSNRCFKYRVTEKNEAIIDSLPQENSAIDGETFIPHPDGGMLVIQIVQPNPASTDVLRTLITTFSYTNIKKFHPMQICPDVWPTQEKQVNYNGVIIPVENVDSEWINNNCKYPQQ